MFGKQLFLLRYLYFFTHYSTVFILYVMLPPATLYRQNVFIYLFVCLFSMKQKLQLYFSPIVTYLSEIYWDIFWLFFFFFLFYTVFL